MRLQEELEEIADSLTQEDLYIATIIHNHYTQLAANEEDRQPEFVFIDTKAYPKAPSRVDLIELFK